MADNTEEQQEKIKIYINIQPLNLKLGALFSKSETFQSVINFVYNQTKKLDIKFELGKIIENSSEAIILPEFQIGDFLKASDEISVFSNYGLKNNISNLYKTFHFLKKKRKEEIKNEQKIKEEIDKKEENLNNSQKNQKNKEQKVKTPKKNENKETKENKEKKENKENTEKAKNKSDKKQKSVKKNKHDDEDIKLDDESSEKNSDN